MRQLDRSSDMVGQRIRRKRLMENMTQPDLSELTGINTSALSRIENGKQILRIDELAVIAKALNVNMSYLLGLRAETKFDEKEISDVIGLSEESVEVLMNHDLSTGLLMGIDGVIKNKRINNVANSVINTLLPDHFDKMGK